ncbi:HBL/NHE enterotoxin family protein [Providencia stuartii]|uniref:HBL/NHE enterotoxin family protein n=3 Tax=Providencia TaxID=586 RepID=A0AAI9MWB5_PROST|nr:HBL/NHE enterotoxin family protein [Providencia stuartii]MTB41445.1 HBL/NHE enterotoxin family protein [Providencia sp. wls1949]MTC07388.1 HBL/NHE enterotoxin family protein [Providencia sp. wls1948]QIC14198.1 alpha-helical pore-forming toxin family protein [Providencia vermicola]ELR5122788.1 HBL/NHE enterotoxin family protein [Providencia stuartii]
MRYIMNFSQSPLVINNANKKQSSSDLIVQSSCRSVLQQPFVNFTNNPSLINLQQDVNSALGIAKENSNYYLDTIQPMIISNISSISAYYTMHNSIATQVPAGTSISDWLNILSAIRDQSKTYASEAHITSTLLSQFSHKLDNSVSSFYSVVDKLNAAILGDNGALAQNRNKLIDIQTQIAVDEVGITLGAISIVGGLISIVVGIASSFFTGGATITMVIGGGVAIATGVAGITGATLKLKGDLKLKEILLVEDANLKNEVRVAQACSAGNAQLAVCISQAAQSSLDMSNAWGFLSNDIESLINDLNMGIISGDKVRELFLSSANNQVKIVLKDTDIIKSQMSGIEYVINPTKYTYDLINVN